MKNKVLAIAALVAIAACKKEIPKSPEMVVEPHYMQVSELDFPIIPNPHDVNDYIVNPVDLDDQKIQSNLQNIGLLARDLFKSSYYNQLIIDEAVGHDNFCMKYSMFLSSAQALNTEHQQIMSALQNEIAGMDFTRSITTPEGENITEIYIPAIFVVNAETADPTYAPIVSAGVYVKPEYSETEAYDDYIVAWVYDDAMNTWLEILLNEDMVNSTRHPIFIMDNAEEAISNRPRTQFINSQPGKTTTTKKLFAMNDYKINYRYECCGNSELAVACILIDENGGIHQTLFKNNGTSLTQEEKASIFKSSIGKMHWNQWRSITELEFQVVDLEPFNQNYLYWNTFERDYAKSDKSLGSGSGNGTTVYLNGRRKYSNEWYTYNPSVTLSPLDFNYIWGAWAKAHVNVRSDIRIWRYGGN